MPANPVDFAEVKRLWEANAWVILLIHPKKCPAVSFSLLFLFALGKELLSKGGNQLCSCSKWEKKSLEKQRREWKSNFEAIWGRGKMSQNFKVENLNESSLLDYTQNKQQSKDKFFVVWKWKSLLLILQTQQSSCYYRCSYPIITCWNSNNKVRSVWSRTFD